jgi:hypothetical protein
MKVENLNGYANQFVIYLENLKGICFQSYKTGIAVFYNEVNKLQLKGNMWDYSATTRRHFKAFINEHTPFTYENKQQWLKEIKNNDNIEVLK